VAEFSEDERAALARAGHALPDGSYPMKTCGDVENARQAYGRAPESHRAELAALINKRNEELHCGQPRFEPGGEPATGQPAG
jgi:hypothetical protein